MNLTKLQSDTFSAMLGSEEISGALSKKLFEKINKVGVVSVLAVTAFLSSGFVHADNGNAALGGTVGLSVLTGILTDGSKPVGVPRDCNVQGTNGYKVGGAGSAGAYALSNLGNGNGKKILTVAGGFIAASAAQTAENNRIRNDCLKEQAQKQSQYNNNNNGNNNNGVYSNNGYKPQYPTANMPSSLPQSLILYAVENHQGIVTYISIADSPGVVALKGQRGNLNPFSNNAVQVDMAGTMENMINSYNALEKQSSKYLSVSNGRTMDGQQISNNRDAIDQEAANVQVAFTQYSKNRAFFAQTADNAAMSGFNLSNYAKALDYLNVPEPLKLAYGGKNINRFTTLTNQFANR